MKSIFNTEKGTCFVCAAHTQTELHHIYGGAYRKKSDRMGLTVNLCRNCHNEPPDGVHHNAKNMKKLKAYAQRYLINKADWTLEEFIAEFGQNYL